MKKIPLLLAILAFAAPSAHAQVELVYKTPTETLLVAGMQGALPLYRDGGRYMPVHGDGRLEIRPAKVFSPLQATISASYSIRHAPKQSDDIARVALTYELLLETDDTVEMQNGLYIACVWEVAGKPARVFARGAGADSHRKIFFEDTVTLRPGEEEGFLRMYVFHEGKPVAGLLAKDVKPAAALADFVALKSAVDAGNRAEVVDWAAQHPKLTVPSQLLAQLAQWGDVAALDAILTQTASRKNLSGREGADVLMAAVRCNRAEATALLLKNGIKPSQEGTNNLVPMQQATAINSPAMVRQLLQAGATVEDRTYTNDATPLALAVRQGSVEAVDALVAEGAKWPTSKRTLTQWLAVSINQRCAANAVRLLAQGADPNGEAAEPLLLLAARSGSIEILDAMLKAGAATKVENEDGLNAVMIAAFNGNQAAVERLVAAGAQPGRLDKAGRSAAVWALLGGNESLTGWLVGKYAPTKADLSLLLKVALLTEKAGIAAELRAKGARLDVADKQIDDVVSDAIRRGDAVTVREVLADGYSPNKEILSDWTVGGVAQRQGQTEILELLKTAANGNLVVKIPAVAKLPVKLVYRTPNSTPEELQAAGVYGEVKIDLMVDAMGNPALPRILPGADPRLGRHALGSIMRWQFNPLDKDSKAWRRIIVPLSYAKPDRADGGNNHIFYSWELDQPTVRTDQKPVSWNFVRTSSVEIAASAFIINRSGEVVNPRIICSSSPGIDAQVLNYVAGWKYQPGVREGKTAWSFGDGFVVMPGGRWIQPKLLFPIDDLPPGAELPRLLREGSTKEYRTLPDYQEIGPAIVLIRFTVGTDGKARAMTRLASSNVRATRYAKLMCEDARYEPGKINGRPVEMEVIQCLIFVVSNEDDAIEQLWNQN